MVSMKQMSIYQSLYSCDSCISWFSVVFSCARVALTCAEIIFFDLLSCVYVHGCSYILISVSCPALFLHRFQQTLPLIGQAVLLQTAVGFVGDSHFNISRFKGGL